MMKNFIHYYNNKFIMQTKETSDLHVRNGFNVGILKMRGCSHDELKIFVSRAGGP